MDDRTNTIAGWVLGAGIVALGASIVSGEIFHSERPEKMGYPIAGVDNGPAGKEAEKPIAFFLASADPAKGADVFKKCSACHNAEPGGANALGPNLYGIMGAPHSSKPGFAYSAILTEKKGTPWTWDDMSAWLANPKKYAPGTKMTFAGLSSPEDRANVMAYLNSKSSAPIPVPAAPAEAVVEGGAAAGPSAGDDNALTKPGTGTGNGAQKAENEPVVTEQQAAKQPAGNVGGEGAPAVTGTSAQERR